MQSRSPVRETAAGKRKTACCPCCGCGAVARAWPCCPWRARECCCSWLRGMVGVPGGRGVPAEVAHTHTRTHTHSHGVWGRERIVQYEKVLVTAARVHFYKQHVWEISSCTALLEDGGKCILFCPDEMRFNQIFVHFTNLKCILLA